ncbi:MAG: hypothetical protein J0L56_14140 [Chitinophagales bacterium]|nr:hypothetical protein [Chitinophagales bacterium]
MNYSTEDKRPMLPKIDTFVKAFSTFITFLVSVNIIKNALYYSSFQIKFTDYIDFSEALLLFFDDISVSIALLLYLILFAVIAPPDQYEIVNLKKNTKANLSIEELMCLFLLVLNSTIIAIYLISVREIYWIAAISIILLQLIFIIIVYTALKKSLKRKFKEFDLSTNLKYVWPLLSLIFFTLFSLHLKTRKILHGSAKTKIYGVQSDNQIIASSKDTVYLGRTKNYIFLFCKTQKKALIYQSKDFKRLEFMAENNIQ